MKIILFSLIFLGVIAAFTSFFFNKNKPSTKTLSTIVTKTDSPQTEIITKGLDTPWAIAFAPKGSSFEMLITERPGRILIANISGKIISTINIPEVKEIGEGGLLGIAVDPNYKKNNYVYFYYTYATSGNKTLNRVVKAVLKDSKLLETKVLVENIPGGKNHNGGRIAFGQDNYLYITTGDAENPSQAQDKNSLAGKILRIDTEGNKAVENPFGNLVFSYGHRNPQGIAWDQKNMLWSTEHGRSIPISGLDEINTIQSGNNYGWPIISGDERKSGMQTPILNSENNTWAPASLTVSPEGNFYFGGLRGSALYKYEPIEKRLSEYFKNTYGRIREAVMGPDNMLYITTSNKDGRGIPKQDDDKIIRVNLSLLK
ncbi:MAG: PQQ-dependent sugar dehydrogenase [Candidatus Levybacteria bacterium]|nr:PQQ-dependent sugar dehydrogenase [Candidatus Levybacteria bacterium]